MLAWCALAAVLPVRSLAACGQSEIPQKSVQAEAGVSMSTLTKQRGTWSESALLVIARDGNKRSAYGRIANDRRFGMTDSVYEGAAYFALTPHATADIVGAFSPQHRTLPASTLGGGFDLRTGGGYGYQIQYSARTYTAVNAATTTLGADRYFRDRRIALAVSLAQLSNVPGTAVSAGLTFARYMGCDSESFSVSSGRDVENSGAGALAVFRTVTYDANDVHWFTPRFALDAGIDWSVLIGAYNRLEVRLAIRQRF